MAVFPRPVGPRAAWKDLRAFLGRRSREQALGAVFAMIVTALIVTAFYYDPQVNTKPPREVIFVENFGPERTDADIIADQKKRQAEKDALIAERQRQFKEIENSFGME